jgi:hypothetical protein
MMSLPTNAMHFWHEIKKAQIEHALFQCDDYQDVLFSCIQEHIRGNPRPPLEDGTTHYIFEKELRHDAFKEEAIDRYIRSLPPAAAAALREALAPPRIQA